MSRIGKVPVSFNSKVQVTITPGNEVIVKGEKETEKVQLRPELEAKIEGQEIKIICKDNETKTRAFQGLFRSLVQNAVTGVTEGFSKTLELVGVGYRANVSGSTLELTLGFSHPVKFPVPKGITAKVEKQTTVIISGSNKGLVGQVAAKIRSWRPPEPYLGKGVKYAGEQIRRKAGKSASK